MMLLPIYSRIDLINPNTTFRYNKQVYIKCSSEFYLAYNGYDIKNWNKLINDNIYRRTTL